MRNLDEAKSKNWQILGEIDNEKFRIQVYFGIQYAREKIIIIRGVGVVVFDLKNFKTYFYSESYNSDSTGGPHYPVTYVTENRITMFGGFYYGGDEEQLTNEYMKIGLLDDLNKKWEVKSIDEIPFQRQKADPELYMEGNEVMIFANVL